MFATSWLRLDRLRPRNVRFGHLELDGLRKHLSRMPAGLLLIPALTLGGYWGFGDTGLYIVALGLPLLCAALALSFRATAQAGGAPRSPFDIERGKLEQAAQDILDSAPLSGLSTACILLTIDDFRAMRDRLGMQAMDHIHHQIGQRLSVAMRQGDTISSFGDGVFGIVLAPVARNDLESILQITARLQRVITDPIPLAGTHVHLTASIGFSQPQRVPGASGHSLVETAEAALREAHARGPGSVRAYSSELHRRRMAQSQMAEDVHLALEQGQILPWFQPQISTDTGKVSGFEALARWQHPERGLIPPGDFLPVLADAGLLERLGEIVLATSLSALRGWDRAGIPVPTVGVNFSSDELRNPHLLDKIGWELDRFDLSPDRLTVEVLEDVIAQGADDVISRQHHGALRSGMSHRSG